MGFAASENMSIRLERDAFRADVLIFLNFFRYCMKKGLGGKNDFKRRY